MRLRYTDTKASLYFNVLIIKQNKMKFVKLGCQDIVAMETSRS